MKWIFHPCIVILFKIDSLCYIICLIRTIHHSFILFLEIFIGLDNPLCIKRLYHVAQFKKHFYIISCNSGRLLTTHPVSILWVKFYEITFFSDWFTLISKYWKLGKVFFGKLFTFIVILVFEGIYENKYTLFFWIIRLPLFGGQKRKDYELELLFALF